jgi:dipeptidyl aminopeptidase/acylaminoacyl peptidase
VHFRDIHTGEETRRIATRARMVASLSLAPDGRRLATARDWVIRLWDLDSAQCIQDFGGKQKDFAFWVALSPDGKVLAATQQKAVVRLWDTGTGKPIREYPDAQGGPPAFSPDGRLLAASFRVNERRQRAIRVFDVSTGAEVRRLLGYSGSQDALAFAPDGRTLVSSGQDGKDLVVFEVATGQRRQTLTGHQGPVTTLAFAADGRFLVSGSNDATLLVWDMVGERSRARTPTLDAAALDRLWADLQAEKAETAFQALRALRASPRQAVPLLERRVKPVPPADPKRVAAALRDLDSDDFATRDRATKALEELAEPAEAALRQARAAAPTEEFRRRMDRILARLDGPDRRRQLRAVEVLEHIGDADARRVLADLAGGSPHARLTADARGALGRLER